MTALAVESRDATQLLPGHFHWRDLAGFESRGELGELHEMQVVCHSRAHEI
jgi:hypothetical protein